MTIDIQHIRDRQRDSERNDAVRHIAEQLRGGSSVQARIAPGDGKLYQVGIIHAYSAVAFGQGERPSRSHLVSFTPNGTTGAVYPWDGIKLDRDYVAEKWAGENRWSAVFLTDLLNDIHDELTRLAKP